MNWRLRLADGLWQVWDALFPPQCVGCGEVGYRLCPSCSQEVRPLPRPRCPRCAMPLPSEDATCPHCRHPRWRLLRAEALAVYEGPWRQAIQQLKYRRDRGLALLFAEAAARYLRELRWPVSCVVPVPLSEARQRARGYNQVALWAERVARALELPYFPHLVRRVRDTPSQVGLERTARWTNMRDAFEAEAQAYGCQVLLVDDVLTTGATMNEAAAALLRRGAVSVYGFALARTLLQE